MRLKTTFILIIISIFITSLYGIDKLTSQNPSDSASIRVGLSNIDSYACSICMEGGASYHSGCKSCIQDSVLFSTNVANDHPFILSWSNDNSMYDGDQKCQGTVKFPTITSKTGDEYWVEITKIEKTISSNLYIDENFTQMVDSISTKMCSEPTDLKYFRISNEDGKDSGYGGQLLGSIDDVSLYKIENNFLKTTFLPNDSNLIFQENFNNCFTNTCDSKWNLQDPDMLFVDIANNNFFFDSQVTKTNDYAHYDFGKSAPESWILRFKLKIDNLEPNPQGKGILLLDPHVRQFLFGIPAVILPGIVLFSLKNQRNKKLGALVILNGTLISIGVLVNLIISNQINSIDSFFNLSGISIIYGFIICSIGIFSFFKN